ncbi:hypothetical protein E4U43_005712 [Claviceps pusilla]|uniref:DNA polymerase delta subunit 3 n=1 Tax=Claviceps pusilla TaxID=123648 RepID=A0A9P7T167_9HYPO|nr:hypothetical protein E4U43_005712 [Claviceps pusilla]
MAFMDEQEKFLTDRLFSEKRPITYRSLSKALDIHVNTAKGLLFQFYQSQSLERKSSLRATYLVYGTLAPSALSEDDDDNTESSSPPTESLQLSKRSKLMLAEEAALQGKWSSFHASCQTGSEASTHEAENNQTVGKHGTIYSSRVRIRERNPALNVVPPSRIATVTSSGEQADTAKKLPKPCSIPNERSQNHSRKPAPVTSSDRKASGNILKSFAKSAAKAQVKAVKPEKEEDDSAMTLSDDGDADDSDILPIKAQPQLRSSAKTRTQREEVLRRMMEEEEEKEDDADKSDPEEGSTDDQQIEETMGSEPEPEAEAEAEAPTDLAMSGGDGPSEMVSSVNNGRRRGKRRVVQKKRILDEQGYMVTIQEPGWESFSEDETPQPPVKKPTPASAPSSSAKSKKSSGKAVQGSIMSFFNKK